MGRRKDGAGGSWMNSRGLSGAVWLIGAVLMALAASVAVFYLAPGKHRELHPRHQEARTLAQEAKDYAQRGKLEKAIGLYNKAIEMGTEDYAIHTSLAVVLENHGRFVEALPHYEKAALLAPDAAMMHNNLGTCLSTLGMLDRAEVEFREATRLDPKHFKAHNNLGSILKMRGHLEQAMEEFQRSIALKKDYATPYYNIGNICLVRGEALNAIDFFRRALELRPSYAKAHNNYAMALSQAGRKEEALKALERAVEVSRKEGASTLSPLNNLASLLNKMHRKTEALQVAETAYKEHPGSITAIDQLIHLREHLFMWEGLDKLRGELETNARVMLELTKDKIDREDDDLDNLSLFMAQFSPFSMPLAFDLSRRHANRLSQLLSSTRERVAEMPYAARGARLRVGYLSADFYHQHPTADMLRLLFKRHSRDRIEAFVYSLAKDDGSAVQQQIKQTAEHYTTVAGWDYRKIASRIKEDKIDVLVELDGYTEGANIEVMALRPAPVQASYVYIGTSGSDFIDYIIVDDEVVPEKNRKFFTEKHVILPNSYLIAEKDQAVVEDPAFLTRERHGLPEGAVVFCAFHNQFKVDEEVWLTWMDILRNVPNSVLWMLKRDEAVDAIRKKFAASGMDPSRLVLAEPMDKAGHIARHRLADVFLDAFRCNAHTSLLDALRVGLPPVTLQGDRWASRVAASLLKAVDFPELITDTKEDYVRLAVELATRPDMLAAARRGLEENACSAPLFKTQTFVEQLEDAYEMMWEDKMGSGAKGGEQGAALHKPLRVPARTDTLLGESGLGCKS